MKGDWMVVGIIFMLLGAGNLYVSGTLVALTGVLMMLYGLFSTYKVKTNQTEANGQAN